MAVLQLTGLQLSGRFLTSLSVVVAVIHLIPKSIRQWKGKTIAVIATKEKQGQENLSHHARHFKWSAMKKPIPYDENTPVKGSLGWLNFKSSRD